MNKYISREELLQTVNITKYRLRYFQEHGFFNERLVYSQPVYDVRWLEVWREAPNYRAAGLDDLAALNWAATDIFGADWSEWLCD